MKWQLFKQFTLTNHIIMNLSILHVLHISKVFLPSGTLQCEQMWMVSLQPSTQKGIRQQPAAQPTVNIPKQNTHWAIDVFLCVSVMPLFSHIGHKILAGKSSRLRDFSDSKSFSACFTTGFYKCTCEVVWKNYGVPVACIDTWVFNSFILDY
jgi:hypothetical protein